MRIPYLKWWLLMFQPSWWHTFVFHSFKDTFFNNPACTKPKNKRIFILGLELANVLLKVQVKQFLFFGSDVHLKHIRPYSAIYIKSLKKLPVLEILYLQIYFPHGIHSYFALIYWVIVIFWEYGTWHCQYRFRLLWLGK